MFPSRLFLAFRERSIQFGGMLALPEALSNRYARTAEPLESSNKVAVLGIATNSNMARTNRAIAVLAVPDASFSLPN